MLDKRAGTSGKTVLVAGGGGFLGSHLCDALLDGGNRVICVDSFLTGRRSNVAPLQNHPDFRLIEHDICAALDPGEPVDQIYNLACPASPPLYQRDPMHTLMTSVAGTANLLALAAEHQASFLQASTSEIYGDPEEHPQKEDYWGHVNCIGPRACYDEGKRAAETLCFDEWRTGRVDARVARIFNTYGPRMRPDDGRIVSNLVVQALRGEPLTVYGTGEQTRSLCFVSDLIAGLMALMNVAPNPGQPINLGNPDEHSINELAGIIESTVDRGSQIAYLPLPVDDPRRRRPDITRARQVLHWEPRVSLAQGLGQTISWFAAEIKADAPRNKASRRRDPALSGDAA